MKKFFHLFALGTVLLSLFSSCCGRSSVNESYFERFVKDAFPATNAPILNEGIDLYVDYSTCVAEAHTSEFYNATHPAIVDCSPNYYSIKGKVIKLETSDREQVYTLLRTIKEVNNADLKQAVQQIVRLNHQAVLITDGEYFPNNVVKDNLNNPYLAPEFRAWLRAGHDIYIYSEPYLESNRFEKFRYYFIFTDERIPDNLNSKFIRNAPDASDVLVLHMTGEAPRLTEKSKLTFNPTISSEQLGPDAYKIDLNWKEMENYIRNDEENNWILRGLKVALNDADAYRIDEVETVVTQLYPAYQEFYDSLTVSNKQIIPDVKELEELEELFKIDEKLFKKTGEIVLKFDDDFTGSTLAYDHDNLLKIDFVIDEALDNFTRNEDLNCGFKWNSISAAQGHALNTSVYQSISQVLSDPKMNPGKNHKIVASIYLYTSKF